VRANVLALEYPGSAIFNVGTGVETDVNQLFHELKKRTESSCPEKHGDAKKGEQMRSVLDVGTIGKMLGWSPTVPLQEGFRHTVAFFREKLAHGV